MDLHAYNRSCFDGSAIDFACLPQSDKAVRLPTYMRQLAFFFSFLAAATLCARARVHEIEFDQARQVALGVQAAFNLPAGKGRDGQLGPKALVHSGRLVVCGAGTEGRANVLVALGAYRAEDQRHDNEEPAGAGRAPRPAGRSGMGLQPASP